jgi:hypothetical protein
MLIVQKFHSIHEIDAEFIPNIELLLEEEIASFATLIQRHDDAPKGCLFTYFLFFGPTQNTPIGFAQLTLKPLPDLVPWHKKLKFWNKDHEHWKQATWEISGGTSGLCVFDPKYLRSGIEKMQELIDEYEKRPDIMAEEICCLRGPQEFSFARNEENKCSKETYALAPLPKAYRSYEDYLKSLDEETVGNIKKSWKELNQLGGVKLGDYPSTGGLPKTLFIPPELIDKWTKCDAQVLTLEKDFKILGCLLVLKGKNGNIFIEPFSFMPEGEAIVSDELFTQYALLKFFEIPGARKFHLMKFGTKLIFENPEDFKIFKSQGFQLKTIERHFQSRLMELKSPL